MQRFVGSTFAQQADAIRVELGSLPRKVTCPPLDEFFSGPIIASARE